MTYRKRSRDEHFQDPGPKRILALDGGGLRGIVTLSYLKRIEEMLGERHGGRDDFRLAHYFDLIAGTSTGSIIAAALAIGTTVDELIETYLALGREVFKGSFFRKGAIRARYDEKPLTEQLKQMLGEETTLGSQSVGTGLLVVTKRMDTGSPWPLGNNPRGRYYEAGPDDTWISNKDYPLWKVVRASTAAPSFFDPEQITITEAPGMDTVVGSFVDGGVSPFNNPTLQAVMYATLEGYRVGWDKGADDLFVASVGTGRADPGTKLSGIAGAGAIQALVSLMDDSATLVETVAQWMSTGGTHRVIDSELGSLLADAAAMPPQFSYTRYDLPLDPEEVQQLKPGIGDKTLGSLTEMDEPDNMELLQELAWLDGEKKVAEDHFTAAFDLS